MLGVMNREEYARIALRYDTTIADAMLKACGVVRTKKRHGKTKHGNAHKYHGVRECMTQKHGVRL